MRYLKRAFNDFLEDDCQTLAAAIAYYTVFSLPGLLFLIIAVAGLVMSEQAIESAIEQQASNYIGQGAAEQIATMIRSTQKGSGGIVGTIIGIGILLIGATTAFAQFQTALNRVWEVTPDEQHAGVRSMLRKRLVSFLLIIAIAILLLVSIGFSATVSAAGGILSDVLGGWSGWGMWLISAGGTFVIMTLLFGIIYKVLPDAKVYWKDALMGAAITAVLFTIGNLLLGLYLGRSNPSAAYGAAGSIVVILLWTYYAALIVLLGAEFSQVWANEKGRGIRPQEGAVRTERPEDRERAA